MRSIFITALIIASSQLIQGCAPAVVAGAATAGAVAGSDRRTTATVLDDQKIEMKANDKIYSNKEIGGQVHVNITSFNHTVLMTGETPTEDLRNQVEAIVRGTDKVKEVYNEISVEPSSEIDSRLRDAYLTTSVKGWMLRSSNLDLTKIKVITERSNVYLMGIVTEEEADTASDLASRVEGVKKVTKVFDYLGATATKPAAPAKPSLPPLPKDEETKPDVTPAQPATTTTDPAQGSQTPVEPVQVIPAPAEPTTGTVITPLPDAPAPASPAATEPAPADPLDTLLQPSPVTP